MTKTAIISCIIVAVCIFQKTEAAFSDKSLLNNVETQFSDSKNQNRIGKDVIKSAVRFNLNLANEIKATQKSLQRTAVSPCTKVYDEGRETINKLISIFDSCVSNETLSASAKLQNLIDTIDNLQSNLTGDFYDVLECFTNPFDITSCFTNVLQNVLELVSVFDDAVYSAFELVGLFPNVRMCYDIVYFQLTKQNFCKLVRNVGLCVENVFQLFI
ncbi:hypothetical protein P5V15_014796 [Pogonomyrmex californicus]